jgi:hypothetical protein
MVFSGLHTVGITVVGYFIIAFYPDLFGLYFMMSLAYIAGAVMILLK